MSSFEDIFFDLEKENKGAIIVEIPMIIPSPKMQLKAADLLIKAKIDILQVAVPVRFPWMYGKTILELQRSARDNNVDWNQSFEALAKIRDKYPDAELMPVGFYGGLNRMGQKKYIEKCKEIKIRAVDVPDYPFIHDKDPMNLVSSLRKENIHFITIVDTKLAMSKENTNEYKILINLLKQSSGFTFIVAAAGGKTGVRDNLDFKGIEKAKNRLQKIQNEIGVKCPLVAVCGISTPRQVSKLVKDIGIHVMFGSAFFKKLLVGDSDEEILEFLYCMKDAAD